ncbi:tetratricopeptide repeat protein [Actinomyces oris]|uniref:tetratricopeptide repeat protein n=1 Tax=Actinomyces TaxID=1654 RepID=UPI00094D0C83|nr:MULTISPECIES: tetratricopeptide repeat protein [Actinomyces]OLO58995.1 tetratricopeptide repeat protein [Actinomyces oris]
MADPLSLAVLSASITGLLMRGAAVAVDPSWSSAASLPGEALNAWRSLRRLQQGRGGQENTLEASIKAQLQKQVDNAGERYERTGATQSALAGAVTEMEMALKELSGDDATVLKAVRFPDNFETYLQRRTAGRRQNVEAAAESFFDDLTRIVADEFIRHAPGSRAFDIAALKQLLAGQEQLLVGQEQLLEGQAETHGLLGAMATDIKEIHSAIPQGRPALPTRIRFGSRPRVAAGFIKREGQDELFDAIFTRAEPRTVLTGMRGSGKTQLAAVVAARCEEECWPLVAWINAGSRKELIADLYELALRIGIDAPKDIPPETIVQRFLDQLRSADAEDRLFVFDNVENLDDLRALIPEGSGVRVIITTTRHLDWDSLGWLPLTVDVFEREQSIALLCGRTGDTDRDAADQIADALGDLPVAVTQAAATAKWGHYSLSEYFIRLSTHPLESSISRLEGDDYPEAVGVALFMAYEQALEQLRTQHPQQESIAISLLSTISLLAASGVPTRWLFNFSDNPKIVRDVTSFLISRSIFQKTHDSRKIFAHRLQCQSFRENQFGDKIVETRAVNTVISLLNNARINDPKNIEEGREDTLDLVEQLQSITSQYYSQIILSHPGIVEVAARTLNHLSDDWMPQVAFSLDKTVAKITRILGRTHHYSLILQNNLASAYQDAGRPDLASPIFKKNLLVYVSQQNSMEVSGTLNNLASSYESLGMIDKAINCQERSIKVLETTSQDSAKILAVKINLGDSYMLAGRFDDSVRLLESTMKECRNDLGPNTPETIRCKIKLSMAYHHVGQNTKALGLLKECAKEAARTTLLDKVLCLTIQEGLASCNLAAGNISEAIQLQKAALSEGERILPAESPTLFELRTNLAVFYSKSGEYRKSASLLEQNLASFAHMQGVATSNVIETRVNLAYMYFLVDRQLEAIELNKNTLELCKIYMDPLHPSLLSLHHNLAFEYFSTKQINKGISHCKLALQGRSRILGTRHPDTLETQILLAVAYRVAGRIEDAEKLFKTPSDSEEDEQNGTEENQGQKTGD